MIKSSKDILPNDIADIGGKAKGLLVLQSMGFKVPSFIVISCTTIARWQRLAKSENNIAQIIADDLKDLNDFDYTNVAVRSSAIGEDSDAHSFAGIHSSVLNVKNKAEAIIAIIQVVNSAYSDVALAYRKNNNLPVDDIKIAIVIQKMVRARFSGVAFGVDMETGCRRSAWVSVTDGLGEALVSGQVSGDDYVYTDGYLRWRAGGKREDVEKNILMLVGQAALFISEKQKMVMDIEWSFDGVQCWFVQARPVTSLPPEKNEKETVFDNSNIQESYCGVTTPLTFSYASIAYSRVYRQLMEFMLIPEKHIQEFSPQLNNMLGLVRGRVYYNINSWYAGLLFMPSFGKRKQEMEDMMGLEESVDFVQGQKFTGVQKALKLPRMVKLIGTMVYRFARMKTLVREFDLWFNELYASAKIETIYQQTEWELIQNIKKYQDLFLEKWGIPVLNDTKVMMDMGRVKRLLEKYGATVELKSLIYGSEVESIKPTLGIHSLSKLLAKNQFLVDMLMQHKGSALMECLQLFNENVYYQVQEFITQYGDRCMGELKLETITMRQDPEVLFSMIRGYIQGGLHLKDNLFQNHDEAVLKQTMDKVTAKMSFVEKFTFKRGLRKLKTSIADRELMRLHRTRNFGLMREYFLAVGAIWQRRGFLESHRDIFLLTQDEVFQICEGRYYGHEIKTLIVDRKQQFEFHKTQPVKTQMKAQFPNSFSIYTFENGVDSGAAEFNGLSCSQGCVEAEVVVVSSPEEARDLKGKILVAERTDPGWTPLFALVKGVIIEKGSMLSHSAVIAREMGIPAVLGIQNISTMLKTGDRVRLDGTNGNIRIIDSGLAQATADVEFEVPHTSSL